MQMLEGIIMYQEERVYKILQELKERNTLSKREIMSMFDISRDTARRDIVKLVEEGVAVRTHGGITVAAMLPEIQSYYKRMPVNSAVKKELAKRAAAYCASHRVCFLDVSTTIEELCEHIPADMIVFTNALPNAMRLAEKDCEVHMLGGRLNRNNLFFTGHVPLNQLNDVRFDIAFLGASSILEDGIYTQEQDDALFKRMVVERSSSVCVVADDSKFLKTNRYRSVPLTDIDVIVTNAAPPNHILGMLLRADIKMDLPG